MKWSAVGGNVHHSRKVTPYWLRGGIWKKRRESREPSKQRETGVKMITTALRLVKIKTEMKKAATAVVRRLSHF